MVVMQRVGVNKPERIYYSAAAKQKRTKTARSKTEECGAGKRRNSDGGARNDRRTQNAKP
jgi:hypothetical protein